jgi:hypothetical protein
MVQPVATMPPYAMPQTGAPVMSVAPAAAQQPVYITSPSQLPAGAVPLSASMMAQAMGQVGAAAVQPPNKMGTIIGSVLKHAAIGAGVGAAVGLIPKLPPTMFMGALIGAGAGALIGVVKGIGKAKADEQAYAAQLAASQQAAMSAPQQGAAAQPGVEVPEGSVGTVPAGTAAPAAAPKFPGAKTFKDGAGNIRQVGTGKIVKPAAK